MIEHRMVIFLLFVLLLMRSASWGQDDREGEQVNHTGNTQPPDASFHYWTGQIKQDTTWRDTVYVGGDVTVVSGATLTLAPETQVHFLPYRDDTQGGLDSTRAELIVEGRLHAQAEGIVFCSANAASLGADWYGIVVKRGGLADVSNATIRDGLRCLYAKRGGRVAIDHIAFANCGKPSQAEPADSLMVKEKLPPFNIKRFFAKVASGTLSGAAFGGTAIAVYSKTKTWGRDSSDHSVSDLDEIGSFYYGWLFGGFFGFPIGVSIVDSHDSFSQTLGGGILGALGGISLALLCAATGDELITNLGLTVVFVSPVVGSIYGSEKSRQPTQDRRASFGLTPNLNGGFSAVAKLRF